jgi:hypothetical protein
MGAADIDAIVAWLRIGGLKVSIQAFLKGVSPNTAPTALEFLKRAGTSTVTR